MLIVITVKKKNLGNEGDEVGGGKERRKERRKERGYRH